MHDWPPLTSVSVFPLTVYLSAQVSPPSGGVPVEVMVPSPLSTITVVLAKGCMLGWALAGSVKVFDAVPVHAHVPTHGSDPAPSPPPSLLPPLELPLPSEPPASEPPPPLLLLLPLQAATAATVKSTIEPRRRMVIPREIKGR